jgi:hypothetical protein
MCIKKWLYNIYLHPPISNIHTKKTQKKFCGRTIIYAARKCYQFNPILNQMESQNDKYALHTSIEGDAFTPPTQPPPFQPYAALNSIFGGDNQDSLYPTAPPIELQQLSCHALSATPSGCQEKPPPYTPGKDMEEDAPQVECLECGKIVDVGGIHFVVHSITETAQWRTILLMDMVTMVLFFALFGSCGISMVGRDQDSFHGALEKLTMATTLISSALCGAACINVIMARNAIADMDIGLPHILLVRISISLCSIIWACLVFIIATIGALISDTSVFPLDASFHAIFIAIHCFTFIWEMNEFFGVCTMLSFCCTTLRLDTFKHKIIALIPISCDTDHPDED